MEDLKKAACAAVDRQRAAIIDLGEQIWAHPETGFKEYQTAQLAADFFKHLGMPCRTGLALTGVRAELQGGRPGPTIALLGELDGIILSEHPAADPRTGAVHACGHHAQIAGLLGAALALNQPRILSQLAGRIVFMAVPAEEYLEMDFRRQLVRDGKIHFLGGKQELIRLGLFDDVDMAMMIHTGEGRKATLRSTMNGFVSQFVSFIGRAAHAGGSPHHGINALNAATLALQAIHAQRETFQDEDHVRVHPVLRKAGESVSTVPGRVDLEAMVRAKTLAAVLDAAGKTRRAYHAGALAVGGKVVIESLSGYLPLHDCAPLADVFKNNVGGFVDGGNISCLGHLASSTDMGDVTQIMPAIHPGLGGAAGRAHAADFRVVDPDLAYLAPGKVLAMCVIDLLGGDARAATQIIRDHTPLLSRREYAELLQSQFFTETYDHMSPQ